MGKVVAGATVSLDGHIAGPDDSGLELLFAWFAGGDFEFPSVTPDMQFRLTEPGLPIPARRRRGHPGCSWSGGVGMVAHVVAEVRCSNPAKRPMETTAPPSPSAAALRRSCSSARSLGRP